MVTSLPAISLQERSFHLPTRSEEHLTVTEARDLLDWLEGQGVRPTTVNVQADGHMTVRWPA